MFIDWYNVISSVLCFIGLAMGLLLGNFNAATPWIFCFTAGMFIYISLVDMVRWRIKVQEVDHTGAVYYYYYYYFISYIAQPTTILIYALYIIETVTSNDVLHIERYYRHIFTVHGTRVHFP